MFYLVGLGLGDVKDITVRGLEIVKKCDKVLLESYTSILTVGHEELETFYGRPLILADRELCESSIDEVLQEAKDKHIALLVVGDPLGATTHTDMLLRAKELGVETQIVHNASIMNAVSCCGLQLYNFGETVSIPYWTENWKPDSFFEKIEANFSRNLHTLCLLDIKVKEPTEESLTKKIRQYMDPKFMSVKEAASQLVQIIENKSNTAQTVIHWLPVVGRLSGDVSVKVGNKSGQIPKTVNVANSEIVRHCDDPKGGRGERCGVENDELSKQSTAVGLSRVGNPDQKITVKTLEEMQEFDLGPPLHSLVIPAPSLHPVEIDYLAQFR